MSSSTCSHHSFRTYHSPQRALLSPARRLPPEILSEIFLASTMLQVPNEDSIVFPRRKDVLLPGQICRYWRDIATSTSRLWSALSLDLRLEYRDTELGMAPTWLSRSGGLPLTLALRSYSEHPQTHPIIDVILAHSPRWYILICQGSLSIVHSLRGVKGQIPCLQTLIIHGRTYSPDPFRIPPSFDAFETAPELRILALGSELCVLTPKFPWAQLRELRLSNLWYTVDNALQILQNCSNLVYCKMWWSLASRPLPERPNTIFHHSNLRELDISMEDPTLLFKFLTLPALVRLSCRDHYFWPENAFISFLRRSSCSLQKLVLSSVLDGIPARFAQCLPHMPTLLELELLDSSGMQLGSEFFNDITYDTSSPCLLPKLQRFKMTRGTEFQYDPLVSMVESRWRMDSTRGALCPAVERLQRVEVYDVDPPQAEPYVSYGNNFHCSPHGSAIIRQLREEGLIFVAPDLDRDNDNSSSKSSENCRISV